MATINWAAPVSGTWGNPSFWSPQTVPTASDDVFIAAAGGSYSVSIGGINETKVAYSLHVSGNASLFGEFGLNFNIGAGGAVFNGAGVSFSGNFIFFAARTSSFCAQRWRSAPTAA